MPAVMHIDRSADTPIYRQIAEQFKEEIASGRMPAGARLPTVRHLAAQLGVTRLTIQNAYAELQSSGWIEATVGRGTFVSSQVQVRPRWASAGPVATPAAVMGDILEMGQAQGMRSMASASPDPALFPADEFWDCLAEQRQAVMAVAGYAPAQGDPGLRVEVADLLRDRGIDVTPDEILITSGVTQGLALLAQSLAQPGDTILAESPTYVGFLHQIRAYGLRPVGVPLDEEGPVLEAVEQQVARQRIRFFYTIPTFQNPTGYCMSPARRAQLLDLAGRYGFYLVEDDLYGCVAYDKPAPATLWSMDQHDQVIYLSSFSKTLMPGLRLGYMIAPRPLREQLVSLRLAADLGSPLLLQRTLAAFLHRGGFRKHLRRILPICRERRDVTLRTLETSMPREVTWTEPQGGLCCWLTFPDSPGLRDIYRRALERGWAFAPGHVFLPQPDETPHLRLCFGSLPPESLRRGIITLGQIVRERMAVDSGEPAPAVDWTPLV